MQVCAQIDLTESDVNENGKVHLSSNVAQIDWELKFNPNLTSHNETSLNSYFSLKSTHYLV